MLAVERLRPEPRRPINHVFQEPRDRAVVLRRRDDERVVRLEPALQLGGAGGKAVLRLYVLVIGRTVEGAHRGKVNRSTMLLDRTGGELGEPGIKGAGA